MTTQPQAQDPKSTPRRAGTGDVPVRQLRITGMYVSDAYQAAISVSRIETELMRLSNIGNPQIGKAQRACRDKLAAITGKFLSDLADLGKDVSAVRRDSDALRRSRDGKKKSETAPAKAAVAAPTPAAEAASSSEA